ncbi:hypothetical protein [Opacimonas viscosa]|uniref:Uncharacterized protein n=1 Tax=Opacimonas viscosa TaxID=2961944 RepID=A0AA41X660_9ALTE|nr:hypothetical protein [Opacimonas viscosa]MCP3429314.1 hypothetical protein [Opacimonas viscosa]
MFTKMIIATTLLSSATFASAVQAEQKVPLNQFVDSLVQQTVSITTQDLAYAVQSDVAQTAYNFNLDGTPTISTNIEMVDLASTVEINSEIKSQTLVLNVDNKASTTAE